MARPNTVHLMPEVPPSVHGDNSAVQEESSSSDEEEVDDFELIGRLPPLSKLPSLETLRPSLESMREYHTRLVAALEKESYKPLAGLEHYRRLIAELSETFPKLHFSDVFRTTSASPAPAEPPKEPEGVSASEQDKQETFREDGRLGCSHYTSNCKVQCPVCDKWYTCRLCHDSESEHCLPRHQAKYMLCMLCKKIQDCAESCLFCHQQIADYYCGVCHLWSSDMDSKPIFHCNDCGICRVGKGLNIDVFHCQKCGICLNISESTGHTCLERSTHSNCPICMEYMFTSTEPVVFMRCGHAIHKQCQEKYIEVSYRCPVCSMSLGDMSAYFRLLDDEVAQEVLPPEFENQMVDISCNDCHGRSRIKLQFAGLKCAICKSYNTHRI